MCYIHTYIYIYSHDIIATNSSKFSTPSPFKSNLEIISLHSSIVLDSPNRPSICLRLRGVMHPSISNILKASLRSFTLSSSLPPSTSSTKSSNPSSPSPSASSAATAASASASEMSPPVALMHRWSSEGDIFPSLFSSKWLNTCLYFSLNASTIFQTETLGVCVEEHDGIIKLSLGFNQTRRLSSGSTCLLLMNLRILHGRELRMHVVQRL